MKSCCTCTNRAKITPAHDYEDEKRGKQHGLESINILNDDGTLNANAGPFNGLKRFEARYQITAELQGKGLFTRKEDNPMTASTSASRMNCAINSMFS
jgi:valyl-tRNA synthetase